MDKPLALFAVATLAPVPLLALGALAGGAFAWAALAYMALFVTVMDALIARAAPEAPGEGEFPTGDGLSATLALLHLALLPLAVWALVHGPAGPAQTVALFLGFALFFGQVSNANAHELIHRGSRFLRGLGVAVYISLLFGHHASAHPLVHHRHVATRRDPNTARLGESYYRFAARAWRGSFRAGLKAERERLARVGRTAPWRNPYAIYIGGGLAWLAIAALIGGWRGVLAHMALAGFATSQLLLSDYVQHYGLLRAERDGKPEPVGPAHSWNAPHWYSSSVTLNAPRHSAHHARPSVPYPALTIPQGAPQLPRSLQAMATLALFPRLWRRVMDKRVAALQSTR